MVMDFWIARALSDAQGETLTRTALIVGTPSYMSPEQSTGDGLDERSDVDSLGCGAGRNARGRAAVCRTDGRGGAATPVLRGGAAGAASGPMRRC